MANFVGTRKTDLINGTDGDDVIDGGGGVDTLRGGAGNDRIVHQTDTTRGSIIDGGSGDDTLVLRQAAVIDLGAADQDVGFKPNTVTGFENVDASASAAAVTLSGSDGANRLAGGAADDVITGRGGADTLQGGAGRDTFVYGAAGDSASAGARDTILDFVAGQDRIDLRQLSGASGLHWSSTRPNADGVWYVHSGANTLVHADTDGDGEPDLTIELAGIHALTRDDFLGVGPAVNQAPEANADEHYVEEDGAATLSGNVLVNDTDADGDALQVAASGTYDGKYGQLVIAADGSYTYTLAHDLAEIQALAHGEQVNDSFAYLATDGRLSADAILTIIITGTNDAPSVSGAVTGAASEDGQVVTLDALQNALDVDNGAVLSVVDVPDTLPAGVSFDAETATFALDASAEAYQALAEGETMLVTVNYGVSDSIAATTPASISWTVTGTNDAPVVRGAVTATADENSAALTLNALANASDVDHGAMLSVVNVPSSLPAGVSYDAATATFSLDPSGAAYQSLAAGQSATVTVNYGVSDDMATTAASASWTITGVNDAPTLRVNLADQDVMSHAAFSYALPAAAFADVDAGTVLSYSATLEDGSPLPEWMSLDAATGTLSGTAPAVGNVVPFAVRLSASDGAGGSVSDVFVVRVIGAITGDEGDNTLSGGSTDDTIYGLGGNDTLNGLGGRDTIDGGNGDDKINGGAGDDTLIGGEDNDTLSDSEGTNSYSGGNGNDTIVVGNSSGNSTTQALIDGGAGNDVIEIAGRVSSQTVVTGSGSDTVRLASVLSGSAAITVDDFSTGNGGDVLDIGSLLSASTGWSAAIDPFQNGFLRLVQNGADTELQWDRNGAGTGFDWTTAMVLKNTTVDNFGVGNFTPAYNPDGSGIGSVIDGDEGNDTLNGTASRDRINGLGGNDTLNGLAGDDQLHGGAGTDTLNGGGGADQLYGGDDGDVLDGGEDNDLLDGGAGADRLTDKYGSNQFYGRDGNDTIFLGDNSTNTASQFADGGAGDDTFEITYRYGDYTITTGTGSDTIKLVLPHAGTRALTVTDFTAGAGGDVLDIAGIISASTNATGKDPFSTGYLRLMQNGAHTELQWDRDGAGTDMVWSTVAVFQNVQASSLTSHNFSPAYDPQGNGAGNVINGDEGDNNITGTLNNDVINGLGGRDTLNGGDGDDILNGGGDNDTLAGGKGNDVLYGDAGDDKLSDNLGSNRFYGGDGKDTITLDNANGATSGQFADGGADNDTFDITYRYGDYTITTGAGSDTIKLNFAHVGTRAITVTDFSGGEGGDVLDISHLLSASLTNYTSKTDPFQTGHLRLVQNGLDAELQWDKDGTGSSTTWTTLVVFQNTDAASLTSHNFKPGYNPNGSGLGITLDGTDGKDTLTGTLNNDIINGLKGDDTIGGSEGNDVINGGEGIDTINGNEGNDVLYGDAGDDKLSDNLGSNQFYGGEGKDTITLDNANGTTASQFADGGADNDTFDITYRYGDYTITTGTGSDTIKLNFPHVGTRTVTITDFSGGAGGDVLDLSHMLTVSFTNYISKTDPFQTGHLRLVQNGVDAELQWDKDGTGSSATWTTFVVFQNTDAASLTYHNFKPGYNPNGSGLGITMDGSDGKDTLTGTLNNDTINGLKGDDMLSGSEGNDVINGGEGIDTLNGNEGNDLLYGDAGDDKLSDNLGSNQFYGGDGKDTITINNAVTASQFADGGADNDTFDISYRAGDHIITTGTGSDTIKLNSPQVGTGIITVTDFTTGASGDVFDIAGLVSSSGANGKDPFATGYLRLLQRGDNVELQWDKDGAANGAVWTTVVVFEDTVASAYTKANLATVYNPVVAQDAGLVGLADPLHDGYI